MNPKEDPQRNDTLYTRRAVLPVLGILLASCVAPQVVVSESPTATSAPSTPRSTPTLSVDNRASKAPLPPNPEVLKLIDARGAFLDSWLHLLSSQQGNSNLSLAFQIANLDTWKAYFDSLKKGQPITPPADNLDVTWLGKLHYLVNGEYRGIKYVGEMQFKNIKLDAGKFILPAIDLENDKDKGITWRGAVDISFWRKWRQSIVGTSNGTKDEARMIAWLNEPVKLTQNFTDWETEGTNKQMVFRNGTWDPINFRLPDPGGSPKFKEFDLPSTALMSDTTLGPCQLRSAYCTDIAVEIK